MTQRWQVGDQLYFQGRDGGRVLIEITAVREEDYEWKYPDLGETTPSGVPNSFCSINSTDPKLFWWQRWEGTRVTPEEEKR